MSMVNKIKAEYNYKETPKTKNEFLAILDSNLTFYRQSVEYQLNIIKTIANSS
jgi:hypothetical protein